MLLLIYLMTSFDHFYLSPPQRSSRFTFIMYLAACREGAGGETVLLEREGPSIETSGRVMAAIRPVAGRCEIT